MVRLSFAGIDFFALPKGALYWPDRRALIVADLHFEKASWFAARGQMLPPYDSRATLADLAALIDTLDAAEVWCLGDSFHDADGPGRLDEATAAALRRLSARIGWHWIGGNHDVHLTDPFGGHVVDEAVIDGIILRHQAVPGEARPEISGHFHPKFRVSLRGRLVSRRCFVASESKLVLPAFGTLAGGLDASDPAIIGAVGRSAAALVPIADRLLRFTLAA